MASSSRKKRARKGGEKKAGTGRNEKKKGTNNEKKLAAEVRDEKELAKERRNEVSRKRYAEDADYREKLLAYQREYKREHRGPPPPLTPEEKDKRNARDRERWATDPDYRAGKLVFHAENARRQELKRRYGLSWEDYIRRCWRAKAAPAPSANANSPTHRSLIIATRPARCAGCSAATAIPVLAASRTTRTGCWPRCNICWNSWVIKRRSA